MEETKININVLNIPKTKQTSIIVPDIENQTTDFSVNSPNITVNQEDLSTFKMVGYLLLTVMIILYTAFIVCDIYYAFNDHSCVNQSVDRISLTLKTFLLVRGFMLLGLISSLLTVLCTITPYTFNFCTCAQISIFVLASMFLLAWNISGAVLFWGYMDTDQCDNPVYNYVFASLIIIFVASFGNLVSSNKKKD